MKDQFNEYINKVFLPVMAGAQEAVQELNYSLQPDVEMFVVSRPFLSLDGFVHGADRKNDWIRKNFPEIKPMNIAVVGNKMPCFAEALMVIEDDLRTLTDTRDAYGNGKVLVCFTRPWNDSEEDRELKTENGVVNLQKWGDLITKTKDLRGDMYV